jgi:acyl carrier protein
MRAFASRRVGPLSQSAGSRLQPHPARLRRVALPIEGREEELAIGAPSHYTGLPRDRSARVAEGDIRGWVRRYLAGVLGIDEARVELDRTLEAYGLDSIEAVLMAGALEDELGFEVDPAAFLQFPTIEAMVAALESGEGQRLLIEYAAP